MINKYIVEESGELLAFLLKNVKNKSKNNIKSLLSNKNIEVNNNIITKHNFLLRPNDVITIVPKSRTTNIDIIYEDNNIIVINKEEGLLTIGTEQEKDNTAYHYVSSYLKEQNKNAKVFVIHRLDQETSGVLMFAKSEKIKNSYQENWDKLVSLRSYIAILDGVLKKESGTIRNYLNVETYRVFQTTDKSIGKEAITHFLVLKKTNSHTLVEVKIDTGRRNQIRVHFAELGFPIVGDLKYGKKGKRLMLHANKLEIINPLTNKKMIFEAKSPQIFNTIMKER